MSVPGYIFAGSKSIGGRHDWQTVQYTFTPDAGGEPVSVERT